MEGVEEGVHLLSRERDGVEVEVVLQAEGCAAGGGWDEMAGGVSQPSSSGAFLM